MWRSSFVLPLLLLRLLLLFPVALVGSSTSYISVCDVANLSPCRSFITGVASKPSASCCSRLVVAIMRSPKPKCLCSVLRDGNPPVAVNDAQVLALAAACELRPHPVRRCFDGSATTNSPTKYPKVISANSTRALDTERFCPDCRDGSIDDPSPLLPIPPPELGPNP